jgi:hypothetical protein
MAGTTHFEKRNLVIKFLTFLSTLIIAIVVSSQSYQSETNKGQQYTLDTMIKAMVLNASDKQAEQIAGMVLMDSFENEDFFIAFNLNTRQGEHLKKAINHMKEMVYTQGKKTLDTPNIDSKSVEQWVYIGQYNATKNKWDTKYLDAVSDQDNPASLDTASLKTRIFSIRSETGALNVRSGSATETYIAPVICVLSEGKKIKINAIKPSGNNPHYWGRLSPDSPGSCTS